MKMNINNLYGAYPIYIYYANQLLEIAHSNDFYKTFINLPDGAYYIQPFANNGWIVKRSGTGQFVNENSVPPETRTLHLLLTN